MWTLIGLGTGVAYLYSAVAVVAPDVFFSTFAASGRMQVYSEAAAVIISLTLLGQIFEPKACPQTSAATKSLLGLVPKMARRINADDSEEDAPIAHIHVGDLLHMRPGEKVSADGVVVASASALDESIIAGESVPVSKRAGDRVIGATMSTSGTLAARPEKVSMRTVSSQAA